MKSKLYEIDIVARSTELLLTALHHIEIRTIRWNDEESWTHVGNYGYFNQRPVTPASLCRVQRAQLALLKRGQR